MYKDSHPPLKFRESDLCRLLYEDRAVLVVDKRAGVLTTPTPKTRQKTVIQALERYLSFKGKRRVAVFAVHRLDRDTSGLLVFAKDEKTKEALIEQFKERKPQRTYIALVKGHLENSAGRLEDRVFVDEYFNQKVARKGRIGQAAILHYQVLSQLEDASLVKINLETGRKNQIRVQFATRGHPVLGDSRYEVETARHRAWKEKRLALHAAELGFSHPHSKKPFNFKANLPREMKVFVERTGGR